MRLGRQIIALCVLATAGVSCAATSDTTPPRKEAVLLNTDRSDIREAIRIFVRQDAGRFLIADPGSLALSPDLVVHRRASDFQLRSRTLPTANTNYRLMSNGTQCWLIRHESDQNSPIAAELLLPETARCALISN